MIQYCSARAERKISFDKRLLAGVAAAFLLLAGAVPAAAETGPQGIQAESYVVMDADSGQVLLAKNAEEQVEPASVTKIMTLGLACQKANGDWTQQLTVSYDAVHAIYGTDSSHIALQEGETVTLEQMLYATELASANDAANVLAEYIGGSMDGGVAAMNAQAAALGLANTHFSNAHGISAAEHYTSAADMAMILRWALEQPGFFTLFSTTGMYTMPPTDKNPESRYFSLQDHMRRETSMYYVPELTGSKLGYTDTARYTYACTAQKDDLNLICVVMKSPLKSDKYADVQSLMGYSFSHFRHVTIPQTEEAVYVDVQGGGEALGTISASVPQVNVTLDTSLDAGAVMLAQQQYTYNMGGDAPQAVYEVSGQGVQEDTAVAVSMKLDGLPDLLGTAEQQQLPAAAVEKKLSAEQKVAHISFWMAIPIAAVCIGFLLLRAGRLGTPKRRKQLRKGEK